MRYSHRITSVLVLFSALALTSCEYGDLSLRTGPRSFSTRGGAAQPSFLVGRWQRVTVFQEFDERFEKETTWEFRSDGLAVRTVVTRNLTLGFADIDVDGGVWRVNDGTIIVTFTDPREGTLLLDFVLVGSLLRLNGLEFVRLP